jgi:hypothetical protein
MSSRSLLLVSRLLRRDDGDGDEDDTPEGAAAILHGELVGDMPSASMLSDHTFFSYIPSKYGTSC